MTILGILRLPFRLARLPFSLALLVVGVKQKICGRRFHLPVAGLDESKAQSILFALRRAATTLQEEAVADDWLAALQLVQVASGRLLGELDRIEANLEFWSRQLERGGHFWFALLQRGPGEFWRRVGGLAARWRRDRRAADPAPLSDAELAEKRVLLLRVLRVALCDAVCGVQRAGALLHLQQQHSEGADMETDAVIFQRAREAVQLSLQLVVQTYGDLRSSVHTTLDAQQDPTAAAARDRPMVVQALNRVLGMSRVRRIATRLELTEGDATEQKRGVAPAQTPLEGLSASAASFAEAQCAVGFADVLPPGAAVHGALAAAASAIAGHHQRRLVQLPAWVRMPTQAQRHWVRYTVALVAAGYGTLFIVRHSPLVGSHDLEDWGRAAARAVRSAFAEHIVGPLDRVRNELFNTFRARPAIVSMGEYEADRDSLQRMLDEFKRDYVRRRGVGAALRGTAATIGPEASSNASSGGGGSAAASLPDGTIGSVVVAESDAQLLHGMELMMRCYEDQLKQPLKNLVAGDLMRSLLIQVQKLKVDTESAMLEIDQILHANELSISLLAAVPAFLLGGTALYSVGHMLTPAPPDPKREALPARMALMEVERALEVLAAPKAGGQAPQPEQQGMFVYRLAVAFAEAETLFQRHRSLLRGGGDAEWTLVRADLLDLAGPAPAEHKLRTAARMMRGYAIYQQL